MRCQNGASPGLHPACFSPPAAQQTQVQTSAPEQPPGSQAAVPGKAAWPQQPMGARQGLDARKPCPELQPLVAGGFRDPECQQDSSTLRAQPCPCLVPASGLGERLSPQGRAVCTLPAAGLHARLGGEEAGCTRVTCSSVWLPCGSADHRLHRLLCSLEHPLQEQPLFWVLFWGPGRGLGGSTGDLKPALWTPEQTSW